MTMRYTLTLVRRAAFFRVPVLAAFLALSLGGCQADELTNTLTDDLSEAAEPIGTVEAPSLSSSFTGGIPFGNFAQPTSAFGELFNGAMRNIAPHLLTNELAATKARGGKVVLMFAGNEEYYKTNGYFDLGKWKARVKRYASVNFSSYVQDGTVVGHFLIDEPNDPANWNRKPVSPAVLEEMAKYSKQLWPSLTTVVRVEPSYLGNTHRYLNAAWAQYLHRRGSADDYIRRNVADAQKKGLALVLGMNVLVGGPNKRAMTASEVKSWGTTLLSNSYPCAFINWRYNSDYLSSSSMKEAMNALRSKAQSRSSKTCA